MITCPVCGNRNPDAAESCPLCGAELSSTDYGLKTEYAGTQGMVWSPGELIAGQYKVVRALGRGGMGMVYLVRNTHLREREEALKVLFPHLSGDANVGNLFEEEVLICQELPHPDIIQVYHYQRWGDHRFFTMEYVPGLSLRHAIGKRKKQGVPFSIRECLNVVNPLLDALTFAHQKTVHRDIKPENIMVLGQFPDVKIKILDFGIARAMSCTQLNRTANAMGTAYYMPMEQLNGEATDARSDLFSVGVLSYEMLTGHIPMGVFPMPGEIRADLPEELDSVLRRALALRPEDRFQTAKEMKEAFARALQDHSGPAPKARKLDNDPGRSQGALQAEASTCVNSLGMEFIYVAPGKFVMGSPKNESGRDRDETPHQVTLTCGFYLQTTPVTQGQWKSVMGSNPSYFKNGGAARPVEQVCWQEVQGFLERLNRQEGTNRYRLPTEAEWEYACRAGAETAYFFGENEQDLDRFAWFDSNADQSTHPVGGKAPNPWGVYDMLGNVWEWCADWKGPYPDGYATDPRGPESGTERILRGGSWFNDSRYLRCANRYGDRPGDSSFLVGFRVAMSGSP